MLAEPQDLYGDAVVDAPAVEEANEVVDPRDLVVAQTDDDVLGFESCGGRRTVRLDSRHQHAQPILQAERDGISPRHRYRLRSHPDIGAPHPAMADEFAQHEFR